MVSTTIVRGHKARHQKKSKNHQTPAAAIDHAVRLTHAICGLAGSARLLDDIRAELRTDKVVAAVRERETGPVFDWLMAALSYQGISDQVAYEYMAKHGRATWRDIGQNLRRGASCPQARELLAFPRLPIRQDQSDLRRA